MDKLLTEIRFCFQSEESIFCPENQLVRGQFGEGENAVYAIVRVPSELDRPDQFIVALARLTEAYKAGCVFKKGDPNFKIYWNPTSYGSRS